jgi:hypothetical protein
MTAILLIVNTFFKHSLLLLKCLLDWICSVSRGRKQHSDMFVCIMVLSVEACVPAHRILPQGTCRNLSSTKKCCCLTVFCHIPLLLFASGLFYSEFNMTRPGTSCRAHLSDRDWDILVGVCPWTSTSTRSNQSLIML